jgi:hypothetical protein
VVLGFGGLVLVGMLAVLIAVLVSLEGTRSEIRTTRMHLSDVDQRVQRVTDAVTPLTDAIRPLSTPRRQRKLKATARTLTRAIERIPALARDGADGVQIAKYIASQIQRSGLATALPDLQALAHAGLTDDRFARALTGATTFFDTFPEVRTVLRSQRRLTSRSVRIQLKTLGQTRQVVALFAQSLAIQREILDHTRSIDRKIP